MTLLIWHDEWDRYVKTGMMDPTNKCLCSDCTPIEVRKTLCNQRVLVNTIPTRCGKEGHAHAFIDHDFIKEK